MKKTILKCTIVAILVVIIATASLLTACQNTTLLGISPEKKEAYKGDTLKMTVFVRPEGAYTITASPAGVVTIDGDNVTFNGDIEADTNVTITATLNSNPKVSDSCVVKYKAPAKPVVKTTISISTETKTAVKGDIVNFTVDVEPQADYVLTVNSEYKDLVVIGEDNKSAIFVGDITLDQFITFTATLVDDNTVKSGVGITYIAPAKEGQVGELTSDMIQAIGNSSITVQGTVTDYYFDLNNASRNSENTMDMIVKMEDGKWYGAWNYQAMPSNVIQNTYVRGEGIVKGDDNTEGNPLLAVYVDKNNEVAHKMIKNYISLPATWQSRHFWNHLGQLDVNTFEYDAENKLYVHHLDVKSKDDLYLMTYFSFNLTPMLSDTLETIYFKVEGGKIVGMSGQTEVLYDGSSETDPQKASSMSYTQFEVTFSEVGTTTVPEVEVYEAPENVEYLEAALEKMSNATNYTFNAVDNQTRTPQYDEDDYSVLSTSAKDYNSKFGTLGIVGYVTEDAILLAETGKFNASKDGLDYYTKYSGYKQNDDNTIDQFKFSGKDMALKGEKKINGTLADLLPKFDISANIFKLEGTTVKNGVNYYTFTLRDGEITRDVAMQISMHNYAKDGEVSTSVKLTIVVDENGNMIKTSFPYSVTYGTYVGYIETTFSNVNSTTLADDVFDGYVPRILTNSWADYICKYYTADPDVDPTHEENAAIVMSAVFGDKDIPLPNMFNAVFDDNLFVFYEIDRLKDANGDDIKDENDKYVYGDPYISLFARYEHDLDENDRITDIDVVFDKILEVFGVYGYVKDVRNSGYSYGSNYLTIYNEELDLQLVFESNGTKNIFMKMCKLGQWTLKK